MSLETLTDRELCEALERAEHGDGFALIVYDAAECLNEIAARLSLELDAVEQGLNPAASAAVDSFVRVTLGEGVGTCSRK